MNNKELRQLRTKSRRMAKLIIIVGSLLFVANGGMLVSWGILSGDIFINVISTIGLYFSVKLINSGLRMRERTKNTRALKDLLQEMEELKNGHY